MFSFYNAVSTVAGAVKGKVISMGEAVEESGLKVGDVVSYDKHAIYSRHGKGTHTEGDLIVVNISSIITKVE